MLSYQIKCLKTDKLCEQLDEVSIDDTNYYLLHAQVIKSCPNASVIVWDETDIEDVVLNNRLSVMLGLIPIVRLEPSYDMCKPHRF